MALVRSKMILPLPEHVPEVGNLCADWAFFERVTDDILWLLLGVDQKIGPLISAQKDMRAKWQMILDYFRHLPPLVPIKNLLA